MASWLAEILNDDLWLSVSTGAHRPCRGGGNGFGTGCCAGVGPGQGKGFGPGKDSGYGGGEPGLVARGTSMTECIYCPNPAFSDEARKAKTLPRQPFDSTALLNGKADISALRRLGSWQHLP